MKGFINKLIIICSAFLTVNTTDAFCQANAVGAIASSIHPPSGGSVLANVNLTDTGNDATSTGWNNNLYYSSLLTPLSLLTPTGASTGWSVTEDITASAGSFFLDNGGFAFGNTDFPDDVLNTLHTTIFSTTAQIQLTISGLDPAKTYTIKTCNAFNDDSSGPNTITVTGASSSSQTNPGEPNKIAYETTFTAVAPNGSGVILIVNNNPTTSGDAPLLNAFIIKQE